MFVIRGFSGTQKTFGYFGLVVVMATISGMIFGAYYYDQKENTMVHIKILGSGCAKCIELTENTDTAAKSLEIDHTISKTTDRAAIIDTGVMMTPALMVDGKIVSSGRVPSPEDRAAVALKAAPPTS